ncbi:MAG: zincin-like metallopeptidase domain-containing protein [Verrucomicrobiota bacterium]
MKNDVYQIVTDRIIQLLEAGTVPWQKPWKGGNQAPQNFISRRVYRGINLFLLNATNYASPYWLTFKQVQSLGGSVRKGEKSFPVVFWKLFEEEVNGEQKKIPFLRYHSVFNTAQCDGLTVPSLPENNGMFEPIEKCEQVVAGMPKAPVLKHHGGRACYSPPLDEISMPETHLFDSRERYYSTLFHELTHSTGHLSRLNRKEINEPIRFGSDPYSREELVAEMGAAFLCGHCEIENTIIDQSASYIQNWLEQLKNDRKLVVHAAAQAQKACDFILDVKLEDEGPTKYQPKEYKVVALRECRTPEQMQICDTPERAADYWKAHVATSPQFNRECECFVVLLLNTRRKIKGHHVVSIGLMDTILVHPREVFRTAIIGAASAIVLLHNHPSGEPQPSEADVKVTRDLIRAGQLLKIEVCDHVIVGHGRHSSLRELGYFYS